MTIGYYTLGHKCIFDKQKMEIGRFSWPKQYMVMVVYDWSKTIFIKNYLAKYPIFSKGTKTYLIP